MNSFRVRTTNYEICPQGVALGSKFTNAFGVNSDVGELLF